MKKAGWGFALLFLSACSSSAVKGNPAFTDSIAVRQALNQWPVDIAAGRVDAACDLFARDAVLSFPGQPDRDYRSICSRLGKAIRARGFRYDLPEIKEIQANGDFAFVRLIWTLHERQPDGSEKVIREKGLDIFQRQEDGRFRIRVSQAFPM